MAVKDNKKRVTESVSNAQKRINRRKEDIAVKKIKKDKPTKVWNFKTGKPGQSLPKSQTTTISGLKGFGVGSWTVPKNWRDLSGSNPHRPYPDAGNKKRFEFKSKTIADRIKRDVTPFSKSGTQKFKDRYKK
jgi:hypothetical protein|tara:strand:+ start:40 stop:435 length:396 start_codon:yes stop_codon:yes gene_type:complete